MYVHSTPCRCAETCTYVCVHFSQCNSGRAWCGLHSRPLQRQACCPKKLQLKCTRVCTGHQLRRWCEHSCDGVQSGRENTTDSGQCSQATNATGSGQCSQATNATGSGQCSQATERPQQVHRTAVTFISLSRYNSSTPTKEGRKDCWTSRPPEACRPWSLLTHIIIIIVVIIIIMDLSVVHDPSPKLRHNLPYKVNMCSTSTENRTAY